MLKGNTISYKTMTSLKLLVGIWLLCMVVLINAYSSVLTSLLAVPKLEPIVKTLQEVAENAMLGLRVTLEPDSGITRDLLVSMLYLKVGILNYLSKNYFNRRLQKDIRKFSVINSDKIRHCFVLQTLTQSKTLSTINVSIPA